MTEENAMSDDEKSRRDRLFDLAGEVESLVEALQELAGRDPQENMHKDYRVMLSTHPQEGLCVLFLDTEGWHDWCALSTLYELPRLLDQLPKEPWPAALSQKRWGAQ